ncbi:MAG: ribonuclease P protein component [Patescibacteria group bacterium]|jgi:ribonuclease P protein component
MLPKPLKLTKNKEFDRVFSGGKAAYTDFIGLKCAKNDLDISRFGILTSVKVSKKATVRNKIKRRIRQILLAEMDLLKSGYDCAVVCRPAIIEKNYREIKSNLRHLFTRLKLYKKAVG